MSTSEGSSVSDCWRDRSGQAWVREEARIDKTLVPFGRAALESLSLAAGQSVIDVGCGTGQTLVEIAGRVGPSGKVLGVDVSEVMVERARQRLAASGRANVEVELADAQSHSFEPARYDAVFSRFGVMFFENTAAACMNLVSALKRGGRLAFVCWQSIERNPWAFLPASAVREQLRMEALPDFLTPGRPGPFRFADPEPLGEALMLAQCQTVEFKALELKVHLGGAETLEQAVAYSLQVGPGARLLGDADAATKDAVAATLRKVFAPFVTESGVFMDARAWLVSGSR
ncbi:MAG TPA: class I SAM-dependent methyltransferase [Polyangiaceae bacterium]|nr:class I SAM-dependent methyltransferase [Polyangiaceae bacterium]